MVPIYSSTSAFICPDSPPVEPQAAAFRSQQISAPNTFLGHIPVLQQPNQNKIPAAASRKTSPMACTQANNPPMALSSKKDAIGTIPIFPVFHIPESTAIQIPEERVTVSTLLDRILNYLRVNSISYQCEPDSGCFDCMSPSMVGFVVQLWRGSGDGNNSNNNDNINSSSADKILWVEVQRRQGCSIALNTIRRSLLRHVVQGEGSQQPASVAGHRRPFSESANSTSSISTSTNTSSMGSNKRRRSLSPHASRLICQDALSVSLHLLESSQLDQKKLGLESLSVLTDARLVRAQDAAVASRALILGEGACGIRMQNSIARVFQEAQSIASGSPSSQDAYNGSMLAMTYHLALRVLANGLDQVASQRGGGCGDTGVSPTMNLNTPFWHTIMTCLTSSLEDAVQRPHEAALSAKCIRHLLPASSTRLNVPAMQAALRRTHELGRAHNLSLEVESQKTLCFL